MKERFYEIELDSRRIIKCSPQQRSMEDCAAVATRLPARLDLTSSDGVTLKEATPYRQVVGALMLMVCAVHMDIAFSVNYLA